MSKKTADVWVVVAALAALLGSARPVVAQNPDSLVGLLDSPDWQTRASALSQLNSVPVSQLPASFAPKAIALLEREAGRAEGVTGEGHGEYLVALVRGVVRLRDPRSIRGLALLGITTSRAAQDFVAAAGGASLPPLDEAWQDEGQRQAVAETWGYMLGTYSGLLAAADRLTVIARLQRAADAAPFAFTAAADIAGLIEDVPLLDRIATTADDPGDRAQAAQVATSLRAVRGAASPLDLLGRLADWLEAICRGAAGARNGACQSLKNILAATTEHVRAGRTAAAGNGYAEIVSRTDAALADGAVTQSEADVLTGNATYLRSRLGP